MKRRTSHRNAVAERLEIRRLLAVHVWTGANGETWSDPANWSGGAPAPGETAVVLDFPLVSRLETINDISGLSVDAVSLAGPYDVSGDAITLNQGISVTNFAVGWSIDLTIPGDVTIDTNASGDAWMGGAINGSGGITKTGPSGLILAGTNGYLGTTTVSDGSLKVASANALGSASGNTVVTDGGSLVDEVGVDCAEPVVISGDGDASLRGALCADQSTSVSNTAAIWSGPITLNGHATIGSDPGGANPPSLLLVSGSIDGTGDLTVPAGSTVALDAPVSFSGPVIANGALDLLAVPNLQNDLTIDGGSVVASADDQLDPAGMLSVVNGGTLDLGNTNQQIAGLSGNGIVTGTGTLQLSNSSASFFSGQIENSVSIQKDGVGLLSLFGSQTSNTTGTISVVGGDLALDASNPGASLSFTSNGLLYGAGTIRTLDVSAGDLEPGPSGPGALQINGNANLAPGSDFSFAATSDSTYSQLVVGGNVTLGGMFDVMGLGRGYTPARDTVYTIVDNRGAGAVIGNFTSMPEGTVFEASYYDWKISYRGGDGNDVTLTFLGRVSTASVTTDAAVDDFGQPVFHTQVSWADGATAQLPTGMVTFYANGTAVGTSALDGTGAAILDANSLAPGNYSITAAYSGDTLYQPITTITPASQTVNKATTTMFISLPAAINLAGAPLTLVAAVRQTDAPLSVPTGQVTFYSDGTSVGTANLDGTGNATLNTLALAGGTHQITATYSGDDDFLGATTPGASAMRVGPVVSAAALNAVQPSDGSLEASFVVTLNAASNETVTVDYATADGNAVAGLDYGAASGTLTFLPGQTSQSVPITIFGHDYFQFPKSFALNLSNATRASIGATQAIATISSNDGLPAAGMVVDPMDPTKTDLVVYGTAGNDTIQLHATRVPGQVVVDVAHKRLGVFSPSGYVLVYGLAGNDHIAADARLALPLMLFGGPGNDTLVGGAANDILVGGDGNDQLNGGGGGNILIAGNGVDQLKGSRFGDVLIPGATDYDNGLLSDQIALASISNEWNSGDTLANRIAAISAGITSHAFGFSAATVHNLNSRDHLISNRTHDWIISGVGHRRPRILPS